MIEQLQQNLKEFDEKMPKMIVDLVWSITDGGCKLKENQCLTYQEEPIREFEDIKHFLITHTILILEAEVERLEKSKKSITRDIEPPFTISPEYKEIESYNQALQDQITYLNDQIIKIKEM
jgi:hypothetical protein